MMTVGSLFSGIGGLDIGASLAGLGETVYQVEIDAYASKVLARHWPKAKRFSDVRKVGRHNLPRVSVLVGGSPCQGFSQAGKREGFCDPRSALWGEMARVIDETKPSVVLFENVIEMQRAGHHEQVIGDLEALGYRVDGPLVINAAALGAPHRRARIFIAAVWSRAPRLSLGAIPRVEFAYPAMRGRPQHAWEPPRALPKAARYPGINKRERLHALGNAVMPHMGYVAGLFVRHALGEKNLDFSALSKVPKAEGYWPTPVTTDAKGARRETARGEGWESNPGTTLTDAVWLEGDEGRPLNPEWVEALMSFPAGFTLA